MTQHQITIDPAWRAEATEAASRGVHRTASIPELMVAGLLAECAVAHHLAACSDQSVQWLSCHPDDCTPRPGRVPADVRLGNRYLDVKLVHRQAPIVQIKFGAQHLDHVVVEWATPDVLNVVGVVLAPVAETFGPPIALKHWRRDTFLGRLRLPDKVNVGWEIPRTRFQPLAVLFQEATT